jgi:hypothetical protein
VAEQPHWLRQALPVIDLIAGCATSLPLKPLRLLDQKDNFSRSGLV